MEAVVQDRYGPADVLRIEEIARPQVAPGQVLLRVRAAGLDKSVWHLMVGRPYLLRLVFGLRGPKLRVRGSEVAGTVVEVGSGVTRFSVGDEVFGVGIGTFAEYAVAREDKLALKPTGLSFEQASVVAISALTALQALRDAGKIQAGQKVLINGASGGVGTYAVQLAKAFGADVTGVCSAAKADLVRKLGADEIIDYTSEDFADGVHRYDLIIDLAGNPSPTRLRRALTPRGTAVIAGGEEGGDLTGGMDRQLRAMLLSLFVRQRLTPFLCKENAADLEVLKTFFEAGVLVPAIDSTCSLSEVPDALRRLEAGTIRGKLAVVPAGS
ncbi:NAD(P)-dependent alcohol dehydrogenase [Kribbella monticola]|uniref:NAD(P)-dependent alcohol dehydrogenase n=1 Tax=Kribbella monticola TaxID=2185285 RepID=UPI000DD3DB93|nr:NAD(P)-dependent alcohol dehydrogenase [Kribbella monticola]